MKTHLDWSAYQDAGMGDAYADIPKHGGDFAKAVAVCINSRQCEAEGKQVMCPSYQVSGDENLSTGGRVRLLKAALSSDQVDGALDDPALVEAMELCLSCKGCKRECENNVDMPLIKAEYLAQRGARHGLSWRRGQIFAHTPRWLHRLAGVKLLIKLRNRSPWLSRLGQKMLSIRADVALPEPAAKPFSGAPITPSQGEGLPEVVLLVDTFTRHFEPTIADAALAILHQGGYAVHMATPAPQDGEPARALCCGRTYLAQGMIEDARAEVRRLLEALRPHVEMGRTIVGLEASCVLGLRDDAQALGLGDEVAAIGKHVLLFEEFLAKEITAQRLNLNFKPLKGDTLVHGHCHQKAVGAMKSMRRVLKLIPDHQFSMIESGCCGMAGTFGLEAEHADMSKALAEKSLMPALRANLDAKVVANGFSCRQQMRIHGDTRPLHLAVLLRDALRSEGET